MSFEFDDFIGETEMKIEKRMCSLRRTTLLRTLLFLILQLVLCAAAFGQTNRENVDLIVSGGTVVTMDAKRAIYEDGSVAVKGDSIVAVGPRDEIENRYTALQTIDAKGRLVLPGFVNGHTHVPMTLFRGLHDDVTLNDWLYKYIFPAEAKNVNEEFVRWGTRLAAAEQIRAGVTTFADMYYFEDAVAEVVTSLLETLPDISILVTSRVPLGVAGELVEEPRSRNEGVAIQGICSMGSIWP